jgi:hypothetical protein
VVGDRLDVIALLVTTTSHQSTHPSLPAFAHKLPKSHHIEVSPFWSRKEKARKAKEPGKYDK